MDEKSQNFENKPFFNGNFAAETWKGRQHLEKAAIKLVALDINIL